MLVLVLVSLIPINIFFMREFRRTHYLAIYGKNSLILTISAVFVCQIVCFIEIILKSGKYTQTLSNLNDDLAPYKFLNNCSDITIPDLTDKTLPIQNLNYALMSTLASTFILFCVFPVCNEKRKQNMNWSTDSSLSVVCDDNYVNSNTLK